LLPKKLKCFSDKNKKTILSSPAQPNMSHQITVMLPYVYHNVTSDFIKSILCQMDIGTITGIDMRPVGDHQQAFIHFDNVDPSGDWVSALNEGQTLEITYDAQGHYWKMVKYVRSGPSPKARARVCQMMKEREAREAEAIKASILAQEQRKLDAIMEELAAEQAHIDAVVAGTADFNYEPTPDEQAAKVQPVIDILADALSRPTLMTEEEKAALVRKFAAMMFYL
jgi:hypothetical protein